MQLTPFQRLRSKAFLFSIAVLRRLTLGARGVLVDGDKVFLIRHTYLPGWQFPGGGVEPGESAEESVVRELLEETGHRVLGRPVLHGLFHNVNSATIRDHVALYVCREHEKAFDFRPNFEIADAGWFSLGRLPDPLSPGTERRLCEIFEGRAPTPTW